MAIEVVVTRGCGFCNGHGKHPTHDNCAVGTKHQGRHEKYKNGVVWVCGCPCNEGRIKCAHCGNRNDTEVDPTTWECFDIEGCRATVKERWESNPFSQQLREIKEKVDMAKIENDKAKAERSTKPKTGTCVCGCNGTTKGGKFLPGHDARFVSTLVGTVAEAKFSAKAEQAARKSLKDVGASDALIGKFDKSVGLAKDKSEKAAAAAKAKADAKAEKASA